MDNVMIFKSLKQKGFRWDGEYPEIIGTGAFAQVYSACYNNEKVAIKISSRVEISINNREEEICKLVQNIDHKNLLDIKQVFYIESKLILVSALYKTDLREISLPGLTITKIKDFITEIIIAIKVLHDFRIVHRDIKPENIFLTYDDKIAIGDFGFSTLVLPGVTLKAQVGTPCYQAPEVTRRESYDQSIDIWAFGVVIYELLYKKTPFEKEYTEKHDIYLQIQSGIFDFPQFKYNEIIYDEYLELHFRELIISCLNLNPNKRPSASLLEERIKNIK